MGKGRVPVDVPRRHKNEETGGFTHRTGQSGPTNSMDRPKQCSEIPRFRKPRKKGHSNLFTDLWRELPRRITISAMIVVSIVVLLHFGVQRYQTIRHQRQVQSPLNLPTIILPNESNPDSSPELFWGTYRPGIYFGMSHRSPHSMLFGMMWTTISENINFHHRCSTDKSIKRYLFL